MEDAINNVPAQIMPKNKGCDAGMTRWRLCHRQQYGINAKKGSSKQESSGDLDYSESTFSSLAYSVHSVVPFGYRPPSQHSTNEESLSRIEETERHIDIDFFVAVVCSLFLELNPTVMLRNSSNEDFSLLVDSNSSTTMQLLLLLLLLSQPPSQPISGIFTASDLLLDVFSKHIQRKDFVVVSGLVELVGLQSDMIPFVHVKLEKPWSFRQVPARIGEAWGFLLMPHTLQS